MNNFNDNTVSIGKDLAILLDLAVDDKITLLSSSGVKTMIGSLPKQKTFVISSIFNSGLSEFDQNVIFMPMNNAISFFNLSDEDIFLEMYLTKPESVNF